MNHGKGGKDRVVPLSRIACQYLENYIKAVRPELAKGRPSEKLFISIRDGRPSAGTALNGCSPNMAQAAA